MRAHQLHMVALVMLLSLATVVSAVHPPMLPGVDEFDTKIHAELGAKDPQAEALLREADEARERGDHRAAAGAYARVFAKVPTFVHALRRQGGEELALGDRAAAVSHLENAVAMDRSPENLAALAVALVQKQPNSLASPDDGRRARNLVAEAAGLAPRDPVVHLTRAEVAIDNSDLAELDAAVTVLVRIAPEHPATQYFLTISTASHGDIEAALASLDRAHAAGLPDEAYQQLHASLLRDRPLGPRLARWGGVAAGLWIAGALVLLAAGWTLSAVTLRRSERTPVDPRAGATGFEAFLRRLYRIVLWVCCAYYYVSMPILLALVLVTGGGLLYALLAMGEVPIKLFVIIAAITIVTGWSIVKSLFVRSKDRDPGERLDLDREPALKQILVDVASRVGTRPVDVVFMTPGTEMAVFERGGFLRHLAGRAERCLILGVGALDGLKLGPFQAVLAHEYGHFSNRDTAGGGLALSVRRSVVSLATSLARSGTAGWYNPAWLFVNGFYRVFLRISQGASRLQECLADRWAAVLYGAQAFEDGLRHVIDRSVRFDAHAQAAINEVIESQRPLANLYRYETAAGANPEALDSVVRDAIQREPSPYDSHPRPSDRVRWVHALGVPTETTPGDEALVWSLFSDRVAVEERMTGVVRAAVAARHGIEIAAA
jgi:Zn-dependent protease with chaperone function